jgi:hypothetical protein
MPVGNYAKNPQAAWRGTYSWYESAAIHSCSEGLAGALDHGLQRFCAVVLLWVQALGMTGYAMLVDQGKAEAALAWSDDKALQWSEGLREGAEGGLDLLLFAHGLDVPA